MLLANCDGLNLILPKFARSFYFFLLRSLGTSINIEKKIDNIFAF